MSEKVYREYFDIDPKYYAAVTADLIENGKVSWKNFYPHETFVDLLENTYAVLSGKEAHSIWVEGSYGTGKSHAVLTVKSLLGASDEEINAYFMDYGLSKDLCQKFITVKNSGNFLPIHRIGSGAIRSDQDLILAVQDSIMRALAEHGITNQGEASLKDAALKWLEKKASHDYFDELITEEQYAWKFGGQKVDDVISQLKNGSPAVVAKTMRDIISVAEDNGITALRLDIQGMVSWIKSIIEENQLSGILFVWDEFSEFFQNNPNSLTGFQTLAEISLSHPFYFMIVTHDIRKFNINADSLKKILDRFKTIKIELPENMAFRLMAQAMKTTKDPLLKQEWESYKYELNSELEEARTSVRESVKRTEKPNHAISDEELQKIVPIHPCAALLLKHLSVFFSSNQRSMFDFIINNDQDTKAFKWFIENHGPLSQVNLLTTDMLWSFFYGKGQSGLNEDARVILDSYNLLNSDKLSPDEQRVLKTVLLMQAICVRVSDVELLRPNEKNVDLCYSGTGWSKGKARSIAEKLVRDGLLFKRPVGGGKTEYTVANSTGDAATIRKKKEEVINDTRLQDLLVQADMMGAIQLAPSIAGRYIMEAAVAKNFTATVNKVASNPIPDRFKVIVTYALKDEDAQQLRNQISQTMRTGKTDIIFLDTSLTPMGHDLFDQYVENMAYSRYYAQNDKHRANEFQAQAKRCLDQWKDNVQSGAFMLYTEDHPSGIRMANLEALQDELRMMNHRRYPYGLEQYNVIANMFMKGPLAQGAECGIKENLAGTFKAPNEKTSLATALAGAWKVERYWEDPTKKALPIVRLKLEVERLISEGFSQRSGRVSMSYIYQFLSREPYGLMPNNITAFVLGFVLKEYANENYFWSNGSNNEVMTVDKMKTMIANAINHEVSPSKNFREEFIVAMSGKQRAFLNCTAKAFRIPAAQCGSVESARDQIRISMKRLSFPIWCIKYILADLDHNSSEDALRDIIDDYCNIANTANGNKGSESEIAADIGQAVLDDPAIVEDLARLLTDENCRNGMLAYIGQFQEGILKKLAAQIGDNGAYLSKVKNKFNADAANWVWNSETADAKIKDVILDYQIVIESNKSLPKCQSIRDVVQGWNVRTNNIKMSYEAVKKSVGDLGAFLEMLYGMKSSNDLPDQKKTRFHELLLSQREAFDRFYGDQVGVFKMIAAPFLSGLDDSDIVALYNGIPTGQFTKSSVEYFRYIEQEVSNYQKGQLKKKIKDLWMEKTGTKDPYDWSARYDTPILCMFDDDERVEARKVFAIMRENSPTENDANRALRYLTYANFYSRLEDAGERDRCFTARIVGDYAILLNNPQKVRDYVTGHTNEQEVYDWMDNSSIQNLIKEYADKQYKTGGQEQAWAVIDQMEPGRLREYMRDLVSDNMKVGIEILRNK